MGILKQACFEDALSYILAQRLGNEEAPVMLIRELFDAVLAADARIGAAARADIAAVCERDPACNSTLEVLLFRKGFHALQTYRLAHTLLHQGRKALLARPCRSCKFFTPQLKREESLRRIFGRFPRNWGSHAAGLCS